MGLVYDLSEAEKIIISMEKNIETCQDKLDSLKGACRRVTGALNGPTLSGAAYTSADGLFNGLVSPTLSDAETALDGIRSDLAKFKEAVSRAGGELLDEDKLKELLKKLKKQKQDTLDQIEYCVHMMMSCTGDSDLYEMYEDTQAELSALLPTIEQAIQKVKDKLDRLSAFNSETSGLFGSSVARFNAVSTCASAIGTVNFDTTGRLVFSFNNPNDFQGFKDLAHQGGLPEKVVASVLSNGIMKKAIREVERPEVMEDDEIETVTVKYNVNGMDLSMTEVRNKTTGKVLEKSNDFGAAFISTIGDNTGVGAAIQGPLHSDLYISSKVNTNWSTEAERMKRFTEIGETYKVPSFNELIGFGAAGVGSSIGTTAKEYIDIKNSYQSDVNIEKGSEYLKQQAVSKAEKYKEESNTKKAQEIKEQQNTNPNRNGTSPEDFGGGI
ncbi:T7SS effector LXG polymorphic toxin [Lactovum odontotermitis]